MSEPALNFGWKRPFPLYFWSDAVGDNADVGNGCVLGQQNSCECVASLLSSLMEKSPICKELLLHRDHIGFHWGLYCRQAQGLSDTPSCFLT